jgi:periplasmic protein TonB
MSQALRRSSAVAPAIAAAVDQKVDPVDRITSLGGSGIVLWLLGAVATAGHLALWFFAVVQLAAVVDFVDWMGGFRGRVRERILAAYEVDLVKEPPPPEEKKEPEPEPEPEKPAVKAKEAAPAAPAQAAQILAAKEDPNAPVDLTGGFVQGVGNAYAGGNTTTNGTSTTAVTAKPAATGVVGGTGNAPVQVAAVDRSRPLRLRGGRDWSCPFPSESEMDQIDHATVDIEVNARPNGTIESVRVSRDPGHGFGREARACAMRQGFDSALDRDGTPIAARKVFRVSFDR